MIQILNSKRRKGFNQFENEEELINHLSRALVKNLEVRGCQRCAKHEETNLNGEESSRHHGTGMAGIDESIEIDTGWCHG